MHINKKNIIILLFVLLGKLVFSQNIQENDSSKIISNYSLSTNMGIVILSATDRIKNIESDNVLIGGVNGFYPSINFNILLRFCDKLKINTGVNFQMYNLIGTMVSREYIGVDSLKYDNLQYNYFNQETNVISISIPIRRYHKWYFKNNKSGMLLEYGISLIIPLKVLTNYSYQKYGEIEKQININEQKQIAVGVIDARFGLFHKISNNFDCFILYNMCVTTSIVKNDRMSQSINTFEFGIKYNL